MIHYAFIDMDCVLVDFITAIEVRFDIDLEDGFGYDIASPLDTTWESLKHNLDEDFWHNAPALPWAKDLVRYLMTELNTYIITSCEMINEHQRGKLAWIHTWFPELEDYVVFTKDKSLLAAYDRLLIDDLPQQCSNWRKHGGIAINVPARWSHSREVVAQFDILHVVQDAISNSNGFRTSIPVYEVKA